MCLQWKVGHRFQRRRQRRLLLSLLWLFFLSVVFMSIFVHHRLATSSSTSASASSVFSFSFSFSAQEVATTIQIVLALLHYCFWLGLIHTTVTIVTTTANTPFNLCCASNKRAPRHWKCPLEHRHRCCWSTCWSVSSGKLLLLPLKSSFFSFEVEKAVPPSHSLTTLEEVGENCRHIIHCLIFPPSLPSSRSIDFAVCAGGGCCCEHGGQSRPICLTRQDKTTCYYICKLCVRTLTRKLLKLAAIVYPQRFVEHPSRETDAQHQLNHNRQRWWTGIASCHRYFLFLYLHHLILIIFNFTIFTDHQSQERFSRKFSAICRSVSSSLVGKWH